MNIVKPEATEIYNADPQKHIESIGRICYKSEDKITEDSNKGFIKRMFSSKHWQCLNIFGL